MTSTVQFWERPGWWAVRGETDISLAELTLRFAQATSQADRSGTRPTWFGGELQRWCRQIALRDWMGERLGAQARMFATQGVKNRYPDGETWDRVSQLIGRYAFPLAQYSASFADDVFEWRPAVRDLHSGQVREHARSVAKDVRAAMTDPAATGGDVLADLTTLDEFVSRPDGRREGDRAVAFRAYASNLLRYADDCGNAELSGAVGDAVEEMGSEFGFTATELAPRQPERDYTPEATGLVWSTALRYPAAQGTDFYETLIERCVRKINKRLSAGECPIDADVIFKTTWKDLKIEAVRPGKGPSFEPVAPGDIQEAADDPRRGAMQSHRRQEEHVEQKDLLERAGTYLATIEIEPHGGTDSPVARRTQFWEKTTALAVLAGETPLSLLERTSIRKVVIDAWTAAGGRPEDSVSKNRVQAATLVEALAKLAISKTLNSVEDFPDWLGREHPLQSWAERIKAADAALQAARAQEPQDHYDALHQDGESK